jgi:undecaprenol kinase/diacylglycerol kinase (ATP)
MAPLAQTFSDAIAGLRYALRTQRNARIHLGFTMAVLALAAWLQLQAGEWAILVAVAGLVWTAELINTALEAAVDLASPERRRQAEIAKDVSAGAVLLAATAAAIAGVLILGPPLVDRLR